jgi:aldose 1-epimerase
MSIQRQSFGKTPQGQEVDLFVLRPRDGKLAAKMITYGGHVTELHAPDRQGNPGDVVLGFDRLDQYLKDTSYIGSLVGRFANRIAGGRFTLDGAEYHLPVNNGPNTLHGGTVGFNRVLWKAQPRESDPNCPALELRYTSPDGQDGFPGTVEVTVIYTLSGDSLRIGYTATTDRATPVNLTNHSYFNLRGPGSGDVLGHVLMLNASRYTPVDDTLIPTGEIAPVKGTPLDFTSPTPVGRRISQVSGGGYDHNFVLDTNGDLSKPAGRVHEPTSGRVLEFFTTEPGVQFYSGNFLNGSAHGIGGAYGKHGALCLEAQHFPDSVHRPGFPNTILRPGQTYRQTTIYRFTTDRK